MSLKKENFHLTQEQIDAINAHFLKRANDYRQASEDPSCSISVTFEWSPPLGRSVTACFDGEINAVDVE